MESLMIEATKYTPEISFDCNNHVLDIKGKSYPENTSVFYQPIFEWLEEYLSSDETQEVTVNMELIYFNSSSSKVLMDFCDRLDEAAEDGKKVTANWFYEEDDEDALEFGEEFQEELESVTFNLVEKAPDNE
ncbi:DUF1987 domain-containing protein [Desulfococcaceae bacterium HSG8]|nr:DUF1987 domain-containing protein [Desulfococcaceae bacterium HSG8]